MGTIDRVARFALGLVLIAYAIPIGVAPGNGNGLGWIGVMPLATAIFGICPFCTLIGLSTRPMNCAG